MNSSSLPINPASLGEQVATVADEEIARYYSLQLREDVKEAHDAVTEADRAIEDRLKRLLLGMLPGSAVAGEEGASMGADEATYRWVLDPIDGTINFARGYEFYTTVVCVLDSNGPLAAVLYHPSQKNVTVAVRGQGCRQWQVGAPADAKTLHVGSQAWDRSVHSLMLTPKIKAASRACTMQLIDALLDETLGVRILVSQAYEALKLAEGGISGVISLQSSGGWSRDAARLVCESAGGIYAFLVNESDPNISGFMLVDNTANLAKLTEKVQAVGYRVER